MIARFFFLTFLLCINGINAASILEKPDQAVFLNVLPQSGPYYFTSTLCDYYKLSTFLICNKTFPKDSIVEKPFIMFANGKNNYITEGYLPPSKRNISLIEKHLGKIILHVRDPREALISWIEYVDSHKQHPFTLGRFPPVPPTEYFSWNFEQKANWQIERFFTFSVKWLEDWLDYIEHDNRIDIKITTFEDMVSDPLGFFRDVINFYNNDHNGFQQNNVLPINAYQYHFTSEDIATWRNRLTEEQKAIVTAMMSDRLFEVFGWER